VDAQPARVLVEFRPSDGLLAFFAEMMGLTSMNLRGVVRVVKHHRDAVQLAAPYAQVVGLLGFRTVSRRRGRPAVEGRDYALSL
jgi:hypothetical protein